MRLKKIPFFYGWVVLAFSFLGLLATFGIRSSFGAYVTSWEEEFAISRTFVTLISVLSLVTFGFFQPIMGRLNDRFGARPVLTGSLFLVASGLILTSVTTELWHLAVLYGFVASIGLAGASNVTATTLVARWFVERRGFAMGLVLSGMAVGQLVVTPIALFLIKNYSWRFSFLALGLVILLVVMPLCFALVRSKPEDMAMRAYGEKNQEEKDNQLKEQALLSPASVKVHSTSMFAVFKERAFWYLTMPYFICGFTDVGLIGTHFIPFAEEKGYSLVIVAAAFSSIALFNIVGTIGTGYLSDKMNRSKLLATIYFIRSIMFIILITTQDPIFLFVFAVLYGLTEMASIAPTSALCAHLFKGLSIGAIFGMVSVSHQLGAAVGSLIPGILYDLTGTYTLVFALSVVMLWGSSLLVLKVPDSQQFASSSQSRESAGA